MANFVVAFIIVPGLIFAPLAITNGQRTTVEHIQIPSNLPTSIPTSTADAKISSQATNKPVIISKSGSDRTVIVATPSGSDLSASGKNPLTNLVKTRPCPCINPELCKQIGTTPKKEVYGFGVSLDPSVYRKYDWKKLTTLAMWNFTDAIMCHAHENNVRLHLIVPDVPHDQLTNLTYRRNFIREQVDRVKEGFLDGINFDPEYPIAANSSQRQALVDLVNETRIVLNQELPGSWVVFDAAWATYCVDKRCYDYKGLADVTDFLFIMSYCIQGQIWGPCIAMSNTPFFKMVDGVRGFFNLSIPPHKLVLGLPWFGYDYPCVNLSNENICDIPHGEYQGAPCSDWVGDQRGVDNITALLWTTNSTTNSSIQKVEWNLDGQAPQFNYKNATGYQRQVHYDDAGSLLLKYLWAVSNDMRGVGFWHVGYLDELDNVPGGPAFRKRMWDLIPDSHNWEKYAVKALLQDNNEGKV